MVGKAEISAVTAWMGLAMSTGIDGSQSRYTLALGYASGRPGISIFAETAASRIMAASSACLPLFIRG